MNNNGLKNNEPLTLVSRNCGTCACYFVSMEHKLVTTILSFNLIPSFCFGQCSQQQLT